MRPEKKCPERAAIALRGDESRTRASYQKRADPQDRRFFPLCELHGARLVNALPRECPMAEPRATAALLATQDRGFAQLADDAHRAEGLALVHRAGICGRCVARLIAHPQVARLREKAREAAPVAPTASAPIIVRRAHRRKGVA